jgi:hypothetical protein
MQRFSGHSRFLEIRRVKNYFPGVKPLGVMPTTTVLALFRIEVKAGPRLWRKGAKC